MTRKDQGAPITLEDYKLIVFNLKASLNKDGIMDDRIDRIYDGLMFMCDSYQQLHAVQKGFIEKQAKLFPPGN